MNRRRTILLVAAMTILALTSSAKAYTITRVEPDSASVSVLEDEVISFKASLRGLIWPYGWHEAMWYVDDVWTCTDYNPSGQNTETRDLEIWRDPGTHVVKVRAKYDSVPFGVDVWTSYLSWNVTVVSRDNYTIERVEPAEGSCSVPVHSHQRIFKAGFGGIVSQANWDEARWYLDGELKKTEALSGQTDESFFFPDSSSVGTHEVKVHAQYSLSGVAV